MANKSKFNTFGSLLKRTVNATCTISSTCYSNTKTGLTIAAQATKQAYNDTVEGYKNQQ